MQFANLTTDPAHDYGITFARTQHNASIPATVMVDGQEVPNPDLFATDYDYALARLGAMIAGAVASWASQADAATNTPSPAQPGPVTADWRAQARNDLEVMVAKIVNILSAMQVDYTQAGRTSDAAAVFDAKQAILTIDTAPGVVAAMQADPGSRAGFDAAVKARWGQITAPLPTPVKQDYFRYGGKTV